MLRFSNWHTSAFVFFFLSPSSLSGDVVSLFCRWVEVGVPSFHGAHFRSRPRGGRLCMPRLLDVRTVDDWYREPGKVHQWAYFSYLRERALHLPIPFPMCSSSREAQIASPPPLLMEQEIVLFDLTPLIGTSARPIWVLRFRAFMLYPRTFKAPRCQVEAFSPHCRGRFF